MYLKKIVLLKILNLNHYLIYNPLWWCTEEKLQKWCHGPNTVLMDLLQLHEMLLCCSYDCCYVYKRLGFAWQTQLHLFLKVLHNHKQCDQATLRHSHLFHASSVALRMSVPDYGLVGWDWNTWAITGLTAMAFYGDVYNSHTIIPTDCGNPSTFPSIILWLIYVVLTENSP